MVSKESRQKSREKKHLRIRNRFSGTASRDSVQHWIDGLGLERGAE